MNQQLTQIFKNDQFGNIRVVLVNLDGQVEQPVFNLSDIGFALGYCKKVTSKGKTYNQLRKDRLVNIADNLDIKWLPHSGETFLPITKDIDFDLAYVTEDALYDLIFESKATGAREFRRWVTSEVLPSIRQHGAYLTPELREKLKENPNYITDLIQQLEETSRQNEQLLHDYNDIRLMYQNTTNEVAEYVIANLMYKKSGKVKCNDLYNHYCRWCRDVPHYEPYDRKQFEELLLERMVQGHSIKKDGNYYKGIEVKKWYLGEIVNS